MRPTSDTPADRAPAPDAPTGSGHWTAVHLFHQGDLDALLLDAVAPALDRLARTGDISGHFFLRYWEGGPHLRVRIRSAAPLGDADRGPASELIGQWNDWLARHPSPRAVDEEAYRRFADAAARREHMPGYEPWHGLHDRAQLRAYRPEHDRYGTGASLAAVERHFTEASDCARTLLAGRLSPAQRLSAGFAVLLLTWAVIQPDAHRRRDALRAGARAWSRMLGPEYDTEGFDRAYERSRAALTHRAEQLLATDAPEPYAYETPDPSEAPEPPGTTAPSSGASGPLAAWHRSVARLHATLGTLERTGAFAPDLDALRDDPASLALPAPRTALTVNRCAHLMCNRLGLYGPQEAMLRHFAARAAADLNAAPTGDPRP